MIITSALALTLFSAVIVGLSAWGAAFPSRLVRFVRRIMNKGGLAAAAGARLLLALLLWITAPMSHTPTIFLVLAALALAAAIGMAFMGTGRILRLIDRFASWPEMVIRLQCVFGVAFGAFLAWSVSAAWVTG